MIDLVEAAWPRLQGAKSEDELKAARQRDNRTLRRADWGRDVAVALDEAHRLQDAEADRRKVVEGKAVAYLTLVGVLIPLITTFGANAWDTKLSSGQRYVGLPPLLLAIAYLLSAGRWAFRALDVQAGGVVDGSKLSRLWARPRNAPSALVGEILCCVRYDQDGVNAKVSAIRMTHAFLRRAAVAFTILLTIQILWKPGDELAKAVMTLVQHHTTTPRHQTSQPEALKKTSEIAARPPSSPAEPSKPKSTAPVQTTPPKLPTERPAPSRNTAPPHTGPDRSTTPVAN